MWEANVENSWGNPPQNPFLSNSHLPQKPQEILRRMYRTVWGTLQRTFWEAKAICCKECQKTNVSFCPKTFPTAEDPKANTDGEKCKNELKELGDKCKEVMGEPSAEPFRKRKGSAPEDQRDHETGATFVKPWWNLLETLVEPPGNLGGTFCGTFWQPKTDLPQRTRDTTKLGEP